jgi:hypothetical protein
MEVSVAVRLTACPYDFSPKLQNGFLLNLKLGIYRPTESCVVPLFLWFFSPTQLGPLERANLPPRPEDGNRSSLRNVVFSSV